MRLLALDIGKRHTGVAFGETGTDFVVALNSIHHQSAPELIGMLRPIIKEKSIQKIIVGLPRLPGGAEGEQAAFSRAVGQTISTDLHIPVVYLDERYSSDEKGTNDRNAKAACSLLTVALEQLKNDIDIG